MNMIISLFSVFCLTAMGLAAYGVDKKRYNPEWATLEDKDVRIKDEA